MLRASSVCSLAFVLFHALSTLGSAQVPARFEVASSIPNRPHYGAALHIRGNELFVGSTRDGGLTQGRVYSYDLSTVTDTYPTGPWIPAPGLVSQGRFGWAITSTETSSGQEFLFVTALMNGTGEIRVFRRQPSGWVHEQILVPSDPTFSGFIGDVIDADGDVLAVGASDHNALGSGNGAVYVFQYDGSQWTETDTLFAESPEPLERFGEGLAISGDTLAVRVPNAGSSFYGSESVVEIFERTAAGNFVRTQTLRVSNLFRLGKHVRFDDEKLYVGAAGNFPFNGSIFVYAKVTGSWEKVDEIRPVGWTNFTDFGAYFEVLNGRIVHYNARPNVPNFNAPRVLQVVEKSQGQWVTRTLLERSAAPTDGNHPDTFALSKDWTVVAGEGTSLPFLSGEVYLFEAESRKSLFCFGNVPTASSCTPCPCGNQAPEWALGGCLNGAGRSARLTASGTPSLAEDTLRLNLAEATSNSFALLFSGTVQLPQMGACAPGSGITGGLSDGLRCIGGFLKRQSTRPTDALGALASPFASPGSAAGEFLPLPGGSAGQTYNFQAFYRDMQSSGCGTGLNTTNGVSIVIQP